MTEEAKAEVKPEETVESIAKTEAPPEKPEKKESDGTDFVELADPSVAARFRRIYANMKSTEREKAMLVDHVGLLQRRLEEVTAIVEAGQGAAASKQIKDQLVLAKQRGDAAAEAELTERLARVAAPRQANPLPPPPQPEPVELHEARAWESELGPDGNFLRPWAQPNHPEFSRAMSAAKTLMSDTTIGGDLNRVLAEIDRRMGVKTTQPKRRSEASVMTADTRPPKGELPTLTPEMQQVAKRMGIDPKAYAQQLKLIQGAAR